MVKVALLIGVSEFADTALANLPAALRDINAVQSVLSDAERGGFDEVRLLENPEKQAMEEAIDALFRDRQRDDLVLLYFSGHGIKDKDTNEFSLATRSTQKDRLLTTAVAASFVHKVMTRSRSRRQVVILDCCFSGAFATGMMAKDDASVDVKAQLGGEGRAVLTASSAVEYAFAQPGEDLSIYNPLSRRRHPHRSCRHRHRRTHHCR
ncbi:MAG: caspase family protein [Lyngbya sp. HA4199-MV5]|jgi:branched-chain amino acid transport system substrate-binding protein|nr:caspase family protein [Lyngbya sp. HA4199-MV5]